MPGSKMTGDGVGYINGRFTGGPVPSLFAPWPSMGALPPGSFLLNQRKLLSLGRFRLNCLTVRRISFLERNRLWPTALER